MVERRCGACFLLEPPHPVRIRRERRRQHFDGDVPAEPGIARAVHLAHRPGANRRLYFVRAQVTSGFEAHDCHYYP